ncbi:MAG TPA: T9SS type A sorting domain-containing protein, partial [Flavipsychrobacter sp.]|nr:T9SS type A sorting domain-containing protein [Flavipsychrobacter sp.]
MRKTITLLAFLLLSAQAFSQNWNIFDPGQPRYYTNANGYLKGMSIDSIIGQGSDMHYFPYRRLHFHSDGIWGNDTVGSWWGRDITLRSDGTFLFPNHWNDTTKIKSRAGLGATWTFYQRTGSPTYIAEVTALDTMTILGTLDSIKKITLHAFSGNTPLPTDSFNNTELILSKDHGFYATMDLYYFPYHEPDTNLWIDDYYLANSLRSYGNYPMLGTDTPIGKSYCVFKLVDYHSYTPAQFVDWQVGDIFEYDACLTSMIAYTCDWGDYSYKLDTVISKTLVPYGVEYITKGWKAKVVYKPHTNLITHYTYTETQDTIFFADTGSYLGNIGIPESLGTLDFGQREFYHYFPNDEVLCQSSSSFYSSYYAFGLGGGGVTLGYAKGIGKKAWTWFSMADVYYDGHDSLIYSVRNGVPCGTYIFPDTSAPIVNSVTSVNEDAFKIYPNPASEELRIEAGAASYSIELLNSIGQLVFKKGNYRGKQAIDLRAYTEGIYILRLTT